MEHKSYLYSMMGCNDGECRCRCLPRKREELAGRRSSIITMQIVGEGRRSGAD